MNPLGPITLGIGLLLVVITVLTDRRHTRTLVDLLFGAGFILTLVGLLVSAFGDLA